MQVLPVYSSRVVSIVRMIVGLLLIYHGQELFHKSIVDNYLTWDIFKTPYGRWLVFAGKSAELIAGMSLFLGLYTRIGALLCIITMTYITFFVGQGKFWYEDQHPFLFVLLGILFLFSDAGIWSIDRQRKKSNV